jgi:hypothetical protein
MRTGAERNALLGIAGDVETVGWCEENTSVRFSWVKISSRRVKTVEPNCANAIGASFRMTARSGYGSAQKPATSML